MIQAKASDVTAPLNSVPRLAIRAQPIVADARRQYRES